MSDTNEWGRELTVSTITQVMQAALHTARPMTEDDFLGYADAPKNSKMAEVTVEGEAFDVIFWEDEHSVQFEIHDENHNGGAWNIAITQLL